MIRPFPAQRRRQAGVTLIELMVAMTIIIIMSLAVTAAFIAGLDTERAQTQRQNRQAQIAAMEQQITRLLQGAKMSEVATDQTTYFQSDVNSTGGDDLGTDRITFSTVAPGIPLASQSSTDDFETQQQNVGPVGGVTEVSLGTTPYGDAGSRTGLFIRVQRPADEDATQGGKESLLSPMVMRMGFQFYDGTEWTPTWDTTSTDSRRLPAAVQVNYILEDDPSQTVHSFVVKIPASDVTQNNPVTTAGAPS